MLFPVAGLAGSAVVLAGMAGPVLARSSWATSRPGTAIACWAAALAGTVLALLGVTAVGVLWSPGPAHSALELLSDCLPGHRHGGVTIAAAASVGALVLLARQMTGAVTRVRRAVGNRRRHREALNLVARTDDRHIDVLVLDHPLPVAYCLPSRERPIVVSSGARDGLTAEQFEAVLAHERAHLRHRHHVLLLLLDLVGTVLPWLPTVRQAKRCLPPLLEMAADDAAARVCGPEAVAGALRRLVTLPGPAGALAAAGPSGSPMTRRLTRLDRPDTRSRYALRAVAWAFVAFAVTAPTTMITSVIVDVTALC